MNLRQRALENIHTHHQVISDMCEETLMIEWDGIYGKNRVKFESLEVFEKAIEEHNEKFDKMVEDEVLRLENVAKEKAKREAANKNTIGNMFPDLAKLIA